jgi:hypothetical protein
MAMFYNTIIAWAVYYLILSFQKEVPWKRCSTPWNTLCCLPSDNFHSFHNNLSLDTNDYQVNRDKSVVYKVFNLENGKHYKEQIISKRIVILNTKMNKDKENRFNNSYIFDPIHDFFNYSSSTKIDLHHEPELSFYKDLDKNETKINDWIRSFFILLNNNTIVEAPRPDLAQRTEWVKYVYDPNRITDLIEDSIRKEYTNKTTSPISVIINCANNLNNPTQEFYTRYLTEMHKSSGIEDLGEFKSEIIFCLFLVFLTVYFALWKGIKSAGKVIYIFDDSYFYK